MALQLPPVDCFFDENFVEKLRTELRQAPWHGESRPAPSDGCPARLEWSRNGLPFVGLPAFCTDQDLTLNPFDPQPFQIKI